MCVCVEPDSVSQHVSSVKSGGPGPGLQVGENRFGFSSKRNTDTGWLRLGFKVEVVTRFKLRLT